MGWMETFGTLVEESLGFTVYPYQRAVAQDVVEAIKSSDFVVVSMPTGSGKTLVELALAHYLRSVGHERVVVLEPTRLLCDQMHVNFWSKVFPESGKEYEGECTSFREGRDLVVSTPFTASKCSPKVDALIVDEVHHLFGDPRYVEAISQLSPRKILGFTALLPSSKRYKLDSRLYQEYGAPSLLSYDFKTLSALDPSFRPPKAIADQFDSEMDGLEDVAYESLLKGKVKGNKDTLRFLESTLYSYGRRAFCRSLEKLADKVENPTPLLGLCSSEELGHKGRAIMQVLSTYRVEEFSPVLIFTSRKATAQEFAVALRKLGVEESKFRVLTGDSNKEERREIVERAKRGEVDVIISTVVGEEGVDIPEARLLIMTDVPKSPLRFYQRLGRLIRRGEEGKDVKYLVTTLTPKTPEYDNLDEALHQLHGEGVDVSYIVEKRGDKGLTARVEEMVRNEGGVVPYLKVVEGGSLEEYLFKIGSSNWKDREEVILNFIKGISVKNDGRFSDFMDRAVREGKLLYFYDVELTGEILSRILLGRYCLLCMGEACRRVCNPYLTEVGRMKKYSIAKKELLRGLVQLVLRDTLPKVKERLSGEIQTDVAKLGKLGEEFKVELRESYSPAVSSLNLDLRLTASYGGILIYPSVRISYFDVARENKDILELAKLNSRSAGYRALVKFYSTLGLALS
jgi:superfamily II DNA or RNA helicase